MTRETKGRMIKTFCIPASKNDVYVKFQQLARKESTSASALVTDMITEYVKVHGDGNPQYRIDQFDDPNAVACPAFWRDQRSWNNYLKTVSPQELEKFKQQILLLDKTMAQYL